MSPALQKRGRAVLRLKIGCSSSLKTTQHFEMWYTLFYSMKIRNKNNFQSKPTEGRKTQKSKEKRSLRL